MTKHSLLPSASENSLKDRGTGTEASANGSAGGRTEGGRWIKQRAGHKILTSEGFASRQRRATPRAVHPSRLAREHRRFCWLFEGRHDLGGKALELFQDRCFRDADGQAHHDAIEPRVALFKLLKVLDKVVG
jgi:hypothetical protein